MTNDKDHFVLHVRVEHVTHTSGKPEPVTRQHPAGRPGRTTRSTIELFSTTQRGKSYMDLLTKTEKLIALERDLPSDPSLRGHVEADDEDDDF